MKPVFTRESLTTGDIAQKLKNGSWVMNALADCAAQKGFDGTPYCWSDNELAVLDELEGLIKAARHFYNKKEESSHAANTIPRRN